MGSAWPRRLRPKRLRRLPGLSPCLSPTSRFASSSLYFRHAWLFTRHFLISVDLCILLSAIYRVLTRRLFFVKTGRAVCYFVWQTLFWFLVRLPSVRFSTVRLGGLSRWTCPQWAAVVAQWISLHCIAFVTMGLTAFHDLSLPSKLMSTPIFRFHLTC